MAGATPNDPTVILSPTPAPENGSDLHRDSLGGVGRTRRRRRRGIRHPLRTLVLIVLAGFFVTKAIVKATRNDQPPAEGDTNAPAVTPPQPLPLSVFQQARLFALRQALDDSRFGNVRFRLEDGTLVLSGTIPSEEDRATVQLMCVSIAGIPTLQDNLRVVDPSAGG